MRRLFLMLAVAGFSGYAAVGAPALAGDDAGCKTNTKSAQKAERKIDRVERKQDRRTERRMDKIDSFSFNQSGGFMGMDRSYEVKLADMKATEREKLEQLIKDSGILQTKGEERITKGAADMFMYKFSVNDGAKTREITFDDGTITDAYRALVEFSKDKMVDNRRR